VAKLTVPGVFRPALVKLAGLPEQAMAELISATKSSKPILSPQKMASRISPLIPSIPTEDLGQLLVALYSLSATRVFHKVPIHRFLDDVCESVHAKKTDLDATVLKSRLEKLLQADSIVLASKASAIQREHPNVLMSARILTDMRPVFGDGPDSLEGGIIIHNLKLTSIHSNEAQELFLALDDDDLIMLQKVIARAEAKSKTLRSFIEKSGLPSMETTQD
jgi:hypothetical protein